jgi:glycosyltransferase A (GT-A) superfamily protein (DUF2064 family)
MSAGSSVPTPAVLVMARAPRRGQVLRALEQMLGADGCVALQSLLLVRTLRWAKAVTNGGPVVHIAHDPPDAAAELRALVGPDVALFPQNGEGIAMRLADGASRVYAHHDGPLLVVWPSLPRLRVAHASAALGDLRAGCDVVLGPAVEGGLYMIGMSRPLPRLFSLPENAWRSPDVMAVGIAAARDAGLEIGILRVERALHRPGDVRAALADPLVPNSVAQVLRRRA